MKIALILFSVPAWILADAASLGLDWGTLIKDTGLAGICGYVLIRLEPRLRAIESAIDRLAQLLHLIFEKLPDSMSAVREVATKAHAEQIKKDLERAEHDRTANQ